MCKKAILVIGYCTLHRKIFDFIFICTMKSIVNHNHRPIWSNKKTNRFEYVRQTWARILVCLSKKSLNQNKWNFVNSLSNNKMKYFVAIEMGSIVITVSGKQFRSRWNQISAHGSNRVNAGVWYDENGFFGFLFFGNWTLQRAHIFTYFQFVG